METQHEPEAQHFRRRTSNNGGSSERLGENGNAACSAQRCVFMRRAAACGSVTMKDETETEEKKEQGGQ